MRIAKYRHLIVALLMMAFIGQVVASTIVSCQSPLAPSQSHEQMMDSGMMDHSQQLSLSVSSADANTALEYCPDCDCDCDCGLGGYASAVLPTSQTALASNLASLMSQYNALTENQLVVSLFRPPISH